ncbi:hypothetical protein SDC9_40815 [bioreactor metagenome]|uniref:PH domain-containing protein n=1 Tax=bioreactor metagenome TaxID=1076179 RepID=A0A644VTW3_9ZZZZ|nr:hypothetical protein [Paludibacter sp.]
MDYNNILKITGKRQLKALFYFVFGLALYIGVFIFFKIDDLFFIMIVFVPLFVFTELPAVFLHIEYLKRNSGEEYELCADRIIRRKNGLETVYSKEDIRSITVYVSPNYYRGDIYFTGFENYHFARILLNSGEVLFLTSLLAPGGIDKILNVYLKDIPYRKVKRLFSTTLY